MAVHVHEKTVVELKSMDTSLKKKELSAFQLKFKPIITNSNRYAFSLLLLNFALEWLFCVP